MHLALRFVELLALIACLPMIVLCMATLLTLICGPNDGYRHSTRPPSASAELPAGWYVSWACAWPSEGRVEFDVLVLAIDWMRDTPENPSPIRRSQFVLVVCVLGVGFMLERLGIGRPFVA